MAMTAAVRWLAWRGGIGILGLAVWDHVTTAGRGMARAAQNRWWLVVTGVVALILAVVVIGAIG